MHHRNWSLTAKVSQPALDLSKHIPAHLASHQAKQLRCLLLLKHAKHQFFNEPVGSLSGQPAVHIQLKPGVTPVYQRPYSVPQSMMADAKAEVDCLVALGVLGKGC